MPSTRAQLVSLVSSLLPNNNSNEITASSMRQVINSVIESSGNIVDDVATAKSTPIDADSVRILDSAASNAQKIVTFANLAAYIWTKFGSLISGGTGKTTPVDADTLPLSDSAATNATKKLTWANLKAGVFSAWGALIAAATGKSTPVDADGLLIFDSASSSASKKLLLSDLATYIGSKLGALLNAVTAKTTPVDADLFALSDSAASNATKKLTWANLKATMWTAWGALIAAGTPKTTPVDADMMALADSAASNASKYVTWANIKATILAAFRVQGTAIATTSGSEAAFASLPSGIKRIVITIAGYSTNGTAIPQILIGDSGGYVTSGYVGTVANISNGASPATAALSTGFDLGASWTATMNIRGHVELIRQATNTWTIQGSFGRSDAAVLHVLSGTRALSGELDRVKVITTDTQDAGSVNILYYF